MRVFCIFIKESSITKGERKNEHREQASKDIQYYQKPKNDRSNTFNRG